MTSEVMGQLVSWLYGSSAPESTSADLRAEAAWIVRSTTAGAG
jgi:hypothetical protein